MPTKALDKNQIARALKAANYGARVGQAIAGNLFRGAGGQFTGGGGGASAAPAPKPTAASKPSKADASARQRQEREDLANRQREERAAAREQAKTDAQQTAIQNVGDLAGKLLDSDLAEVLTVGDTPGDLTDVKPEYGDKLVARGLAVKYADGSYDLNSTGHSLITSMKKGDARQAKLKIMRAQAVADRKAAAAAKRAKRGKKEQFALALKAAGSFTAYKNYAGKDFFGLDVPEVEEEPEHTGVMVALMMPPGIAEALVIPGGEKPGDLHLTLAFLGDSTEIPLENKKLVMDALDQFYTTAKPLTGEISGIGLFNNAEEGGTNAFYASFDSPDLAQFRANLISALSFNGMSVVSNHGFTPHITLAYLPAGAAIPQISLPKIPVTFNSVTLMWGGQPFEWLLDEKSLKPGEADGVVDLFDKGLDAASKEIQNEIAAKELTAKPFTAYKDINGRWRWLVRSSSAFEDRDGEFVTQKALGQAVEKLNSTGRFGVLDWWHTPVKLGTCDFSAMHGKVLVESGTFATEALGNRIAEAIASKEFNPGVSLMFSYNGPEPRGRGRVFDDIGIIQRSLLPEEIASNAVTTMEIVNLAAKSGANTEEVILKMDAVKEQRLIQLLGPALVKEFLNGSEMAEKSLEMAGVAYKAVAPPLPPVEPDPTKKKLEMKAAPLPGADPGLVEGSPEEGAAETPEEEAAEPPDPGENLAPEGDSPDAMLADFFAEIKDMVMSNMGEYVSQLQDAITSAKPVASKETTDALEVNTLAVKEMTTAFTQVLGENTALKARLDALEGKQPPVVAQRASAAKESRVTNPELIEALKAQNQTPVDPNDPFAFAYKNWEAQGAPLPLNR